jgi:TonB family protein
MTAASAAPRSWPRRRWGIVVAFVFVLQLGLIFGLSEKRLAQLRPPRSEPALHLAGASDADLLALSDPTLFALPHAEGFSGLAWLRAQPPPTNSFDWSEDPRFLQLATQQLGGTFGCAVEPEPSASLLSFTRPEPVLMMTGAGPPPAQANSSLRLEDGLAGRKLVVPIKLPPQQYTDLLTPSVVQVVVDSEGRPISVPVLLLSSGSADADNLALHLARIARFNSVSTGGPGKPANPIAQLAWGRMIFEWQTLPKTATNAVSTGP